MLETKIQEAVDAIVASVGTPTLPKSELKTFLKWAAVDGWDGCLKAWESIDEPVVFKWSALVKEFANDASVCEYEDLEPDEIGDDARVAHFRDRILGLLEDPSTGFTVHPMPLVSSSQRTAVLGVLVAAEGYAHKLSCKGVFESVDATLQALPGLGYERCDAGLNDAKILSAWRKG